MLDGFSGTGEAPRTARAAVSKARFDLPFAWWLVGGYVKRSSRVANSTNTDTLCTDASVTSGTPRFSMGP